jgi:hypothetical protein
MEIIEIKSAHSLITSVTDARPPGAYAYKVNCRQYLSAYKTWQKHSPSQAQAFGVMTLDFVRIWITEAEGLRIATAIQAASSPVMFD